MDAWDPDALSRRFHFAADTARLHVHQSKAKGDTAHIYKRLHDHYLAELFVYDFFLEREPVATRREFIDQLKALMASQPAASTAAFDHQDFLTYRRVIIQELINANVEK
jgi:hypothetical protein